MVRLRETLIFKILSSSLLAVLLLPYQFILSATKKIIMVMYDSFIKNKFLKRLEE